MTTIDHQHPKVVFEPVLGRWRVEYRTQWTDEWQTHRYHHTLEEACADAQEMTNNDLDGVYRVVDTQPEAVATGRRIAEDVITGDQTPAERFASWRLERKASRQAAREYEARRCYPSSTRPNY